jgi:tripartite ATP-independent transporter DctM subunit
MCVVSFLILMLLGVPVAFSLIASALVSALATVGPACLLKLGWTPFAVLNNLDLAPLPLFVLMGCAIAETDMGEHLFAAARKWLSRTPAGLVVAGIVGEAVMAASLGTSLACLLVIGKAAFREFERYGYDRRFGLAALLAGGCLGPLIPPSTTMVMYSIMTNVSLGRLFAAGMIPGVVLAAMLAITAILVAWVRPELAPREASTFSWAERFSALRRVWPVVALILGRSGPFYLPFFCTACVRRGCGVSCVKQP